ncbi:hypothetical protein [Bacillus coreaensis]
MTNKIIVNADDIEGVIKEGSIVYYNGEPFTVINAHYSDEKGEGVILESIYNDKVKNFEFEKIKRKWKSRELN